MSKEALVDEEVVTEDNFDADTTYIISLVKANGENSVLTIKANMYVMDEFNGFIYFRHCLTKEDLENDVGMTVLTVKTSSVEYIRLEDKA